MIRIFHGLAKVMQKILRGMGKLSWDGNLDGVPSRALWGRAEVWDKEI
jgi:hypothetical protein